MNRDILVRAAGVRKQFGSFEAVSNLSLEIRRGECFGLLGPNGAGKTILLTTHYMHEAEVLGEKH